MSALPFQRTLPAVHNSRPAELDVPLNTAEGGMRLDTHRVTRMAPGFIAADDTEAEMELGVATARGGLIVVAVAAGIGLALLGIRSLLQGGGL